MKYATIGFIALFFAGVFAVANSTAQPASKLIPVSKCDERAVWELEVRVKTETGFSERLVLYFVSDAAATPEEWREKRGFAQCAVWDNKTNRGSGIDCEVRLTPLGLEMGLRFDLVSEHQTISREAVFPLEFLVGTTGERAKIAYTVTWRQLGNRASPTGS